MPHLFQSTPPAWGATGVLGSQRDGDNVSIHAPRVGGDPTTGVKDVIPNRVSIHAPRVGGDLV